MEMRSNDFVNKLKELKSFVNNLADEMVISSNQITVATGTGFSNKPMTLFEVLRAVSASLDGLNKDTREHTALITANAQLIEKKADDTVVLDVAEMSSKIGAIENFISKDEEEGLSVRYLVIVVHIFCIMYYASILSL